MFVIFIVHYNIDEINGKYCICTGLLTQRNNHATNAGPAFEVYPNLAVITASTRVYGAQTTVYKLK